MSKKILGNYKSLYLSYRVGDQVREQKQLLQEEIDDREGFNTEAIQTVEWLTETKAEVQQLAPSMEGPEIMEKMEKLKVCFYYQ